MKNVESVGLKKSLISGVFVFYGISLLLNAGGLERQARLMPYGVARSVCLSMIKPVAQVSRRVHLTKFRASLEKWSEKQIKGI